MILILLLTTLSTIFLNTKKAWGTGTIYIRPDGSVDPPYPQTPIQRAGDIYTFTGSISGNIVVQRDNIIVNGNGYTLQGSGSDAGFDITNRTNVTVKNVYITQFYYGIFLSNSSNNIISGNKVVSNSYDGIFLWRTNTTQVSGNDVSNNGDDGISINLLSYYNTIADNTVSSNAYAGISLGWQPSGANIITGNNITYQSSGPGIYVDHSNGNKFYHNNLLFNAEQVFSASGTTNIWDDGYPSGGNYYSDSVKVDTHWGPYQDKTGSDGVIDTPYIIYASNRDNYPLMTPTYYLSNPIPGDITGPESPPGSGKFPSDGKVDTYDLAYLGKKFGTTDPVADFTGPENPPGSGNYPPDGTVNTYDLAALGKNFGKHI